MTKIVISGIKPWDGEYDLDSERAFNTREWRWIKQISGYLPLTIDDGFKGGDPDLFVALAVIAMNREGRISRDQGLDVAETLAEAPFDGASIMFDATEEVDELPPVLTSADDGSSPNETRSNTSISGESSRNGSDLSDETPAPTTASRLPTLRT